jgi:hypothetical protein
MRVLEKITGTAGAYVLTGTVSVDEHGQYVAHAATHRLDAVRRGNSLRSVASGDAAGPRLHASGISPPEARRELCLVAHAKLGAQVTSFVWRPILALAPTRPVRMRIIGR